nr:uncharacterized mitochondrial protein AtMg00810-like [Tanacetum cinerariifolium]
MSFVTMADDMTHVSLTEEQFECFIEYYHENYSEGFKSDLENLEEIYKMMNGGVEYPRTHNTSPSEAYAPYKPSTRLDLFEQPLCLGLTIVSEDLWKSDQMHQILEKSSLAMTPYDEPICDLDMMEDKTLRMGSMSFAILGVNLLMLANCKDKVRILSGPLVISFGLGLMVVSYESPALPEARVDLDDRYELSLSLSLYPLPSDSFGRRELDHRMDGRTQCSKAPHFGLSHNHVVRKIWRICACTSQETTKIQDPIRRIQEESVRHDSSPKEVNAAGQHVNTISLEVNTGRFKLNTIAPSLNTASSSDSHSPTNMFNLGTSDTLEATHVKFFSDIDAPEVDLGNILNSYGVPTTSHTRIHKDHPIENVIVEVQSSVQTRRMSKSTSEKGFIGGSNAGRTSAIQALTAMKDKFQMSSMGELTFFLRLQVTQKEDGIFISQDKYGLEILKFNYSDVKSASTPVDLEKPLVKDVDANDVDVHLYRSMIGYLMYLTSSRPDIMFAVCACARFQVTPKTSHLLAVKRFFRYLKGKPTLGLWYPRDSPFELVAYIDSDYAGATQDRKSTTGGCQFLRNRLISWQCKKQTVVSTSTTKAEYVVAAS